MATETTQDGYRLGQHIRLGREFARGGEGTIHEIAWLSDGNGKKYNERKFVAKMYFKPSEEKAIKLKAMIANPPQDPTRKTLGHISIAWPKALILGRQGEFLGFIMPYINHKECFPLLRVYNPQDRRTIRVYDKQKKQEVVCELTWRYLLRMAYNLAEIVKELHSKGYVVGDLNESNILVTATALVTLVDCDSMQVPKQAPDNPTTYFRCRVGKAEYTPPELQGQDFSQIDRVPDHDNFGLAVLIFLLLMEGQHPFAGAWHGKGPPPPLAQNIRENNFPYVGSGKLQPPRNALLLDILPPDVQELMKRCFARQYKGARQRPMAQKWAQTLEKAETELRECPRYPLHVYGKYLKDKCPWCARMEGGIPDPFPAAGMASQIAQKKGQLSAGPLFQAPSQGESTLLYLRRRVARIFAVMRSVCVQHVFPWLLLCVFGLLKLVQFLRRRRGPTFLALVCFGLFIAEFIIGYYMRSLLFQAGPGVFGILLLLALIIPIIAFLWLLKHDPKKY